jgi:type I restriction enzyme M protein
MTRRHKGRSKTSQRSDASQSKLRDMHVEEELDTSTSESSEVVVSQATISTSQLNCESLDTSALETWLWDAACSIRGATDAPKFKDFILPLIFYKRLSDVFDDEFMQYSVKYGSEEAARKIIEADHRDALKTDRTPIVRFYIPSDYRWDVIRNYPADASLGEFVTDCMRQVAQLNPDLRGVLDVRDFNERQSGQRTLDDDRLGELVQIISRYRLGLKDTEPDVLGRAYEYLLRKFAEGQGQSAGEFYTPKEVGWLLAHLINPEPHTTIYDPACGSAGLLIKSRLIFEQRYPDQKSAAPRLYGQELNPTTFAIAKMNIFLHDYTDSSFAIGDTFRNPGFTDGEKLKHFDYVVANPMWNQDNYESSFYENDGWNRFLYGKPPKSSADWGWIQHVLASLNLNGRAAVVLDMGTVSRGTGRKQSNKEREIRKALVESDLIESVILLPENLFYNTTAPGIVVLLNRKKPIEREGQCLLVNASAYFVKEKPKNVFTDAGIVAVTEVYDKWESQEKLSKVISVEEARTADYNLSPSQFVDTNDIVQHRPLSDILVDLDTACTESKKADLELNEVLKKLGLNAKMG